MARRGSTSGFTLVEASLVITVGIMVFASAIAIYRQYRHSVSLANANERVIALQQRVESLFSMRGAIPTLSQLKTDWEVARPNDAFSNPWGGVGKAGGVSASLMGGELTPTSGEVVAPNPSPDDQGVLAYYDTSDLPNYLRVNDVTTGTMTFTKWRNYACAIVPNTEGSQGYFFVRGISTNPVGSSSGTDLTGQIGDAMNSGDDDDGNN